MSAKYDPALWGELLSQARKHRAAVIGSTFQGEMKPIDPVVLEQWTQRLMTPFSAWALEDLPRMKYVLTLKRPDCRLDALLPSNEVPGAIEAGLVRVLSMRRWLDGPGRTAHLEIQHAHLPERRQALPHETLGPEHVNGGMTSVVCSKPIVCYRAEEAPKVWTHEYLHHRCVDERLRNTNHGPGTLSEAYVETWATLWNVLHTALEKNPTVSTLEVVPLLERERSFVLDQAARVVYHQGLRRWEDLRLPAWEETTNTWSYYVVRASWLWCPDEFLKKSPSPTYEPLVAPTLQWLAESTMEKADWIGAMNDRLRRLQEEAPSGDPWTLRMTTTDSPRLEKSMPIPPFSS